MQENIYEEIPCHAVSIHDSMKSDAKFRTIKEIREATKELSSMKPVTGRKFKRKRLIPVIAIIVLFTVTVFVFGISWLLQKGNI